MGWRAGDGIHDEAHLGTAEIENPSDFTHNLRSES